MFSATIYQQRRLRLREQIPSGLLLFLGNVEAPMNYNANIYRFRQDSSFLYFFGLDEPALAGIIDVDAVTETLFGNDVDMDDIIWMGPQPSMRDKADKCGVKNVMPYAKLADVVAEAVKKGRTIHFLPPYRFANKLLLKNLLNIAPEEQKAKASPEFIRAVVNLRITKEACEIAEIDKACNIGYAIHIAAMKLCKPGIRESCIAGVIEGMAISEGYMPSFPVILSQNGETLHNHDHSQILTEGRLLVIDAGAETTMHYASDFTRTLPAGGRYTSKQKEVYDIVLAANNRAFNLTKPGITYRSVHLEVAKVITEGLQQLGLMKGDVEASVAAGAHALFFPHGLGHQMGLDVHDMEDLGENYVGYDNETERAKQFGLGYLRMGRKLQVNYCVSNEPGIYFIPALIEQWKQENKLAEFINYTRVTGYIGFGGIRLEDDLLITENGCRILGDKRLPITTEEVESTMNN
ncbi:MAG: aminopeptidase P family protein [Prevotellaceae bacterium]|jgi:Xaa-Pro aminopeptidase|nr:aminopeptidase P family protein [Prevotellaceae bacterium]